MRCCGSGLCQNERSYFRYLITTLMCMCYCYILYRYVLKWRSYSKSLRTYRTPLVFNNLCTQLINNLQILQATLYEDSHKHIIIVAMSCRAKALPLCVAAMHPVWTGVLCREITQMRWWMEKLPLFYFWTAKTPISLYIRTVRSGSAMFAERL